LFKKGNLEKKMTNDITAAMEVLSDLLSEQILKFDELKANGASEEDLKKSVRKIDFLLKEIDLRNQQLQQLK
jgi:hypothetical protein